MPNKVGFSKLKTALLHCGDALNSYYYDWQQAFIESEYYDCDNYNLYRLENVSILKKKINQYDLIVALHSTNGSGNNVKFNYPYIPTLQNRRCKLVMFVGNEVNIAAIGERLVDRLQVVHLLRPELLATQLPIESAKILYEDYPTEVIEVTHALNPNVFVPKVAQKDRKKDFGIRTGRYPTYLGDNDRNKILDFVVENANKYRLEIDINTDYSKKLGPEEWCDFLNEFRGTLGNESGGYFLEKNDATVMKVRSYIYERSNIRDPRIVTALVTFFSKYRPWLNYSTAIKAEHFFRKLLPKSVFQTFDLNNALKLIDYDFDEIYDKFYKNYGPALNGRAISSRHFDAIGSGTCQLLVEGHYNGILKPDEHYISLKRDYSNFDDCISRFKDLNYRDNMTSKAYDYVISNHTLSHRVKALYQKLTEMK